MTIDSTIQQAAHLLQNGEVIGFPTETVYGLAANMHSERAISRIYALKNRPLNHPLIVHVASKEQAKNLMARCSEQLERLMDAFWPGPLTLIVPKNEKVPDWVTGGQPTVALRMPNHLIALQIIEAAGSPLAAPSANPFTHISPTTADHVRAYFGTELPLIVDGGPCQAGLESTIVGFENGAPVLYRLGSISLEALESKLGPISIKNTSSKIPQAPGMHYKHYSPRTPLICTDQVMDIVQQYAGKKIGVLSFSEHYLHAAIHRSEPLSASGNYAEAAEQLYQKLHQFDAAQLDLIIAERAPDVDLGRAINDRLTRASQ
ncbi:MAG: threonylcarbamoyl-AMP synthase [Flavobacterium sp. BFFFF2]|nr:MAG: threonylcarbamoyl-AMP synthase [Flavobacterium sp. BFFFF2]